MSERIERAIDKIIAREGGFVNRAEDRGGPTNFGITIGTLSEWKGKKASVEDVRKLPVSVARAIYKQRYIIGPKFDRIEHDGLFEFAVDTAVNNGRDRASRWLQRAVGVVEDGVVGPITLAKVNSVTDAAFYGLFVQRMKAYGALVSANHSQAVFVAGWLNRLATFLPWQK